ncbi:hypothetical protein BDK51DRAFT_48948 [Blyttiomyces helicus]|uniref:PH domain-containing protein n=1 Tax=Blyttiomyces helicus TaxID=388810 RepID=A0A4P9WHJ7_9FUNG|nr:hypothetical protein BDK51DRAFT_48948 [Blyttiomyces helicus]|eukprot:RKO91862.1 hypothetical protein BDK51DRAFT_48948 [Blyttiomyces helicus]
MSRITRSKLDPAQVLVEDSFRNIDLPVSSPATSPSASASSLSPEEDDSDDEYNPMELDEMKETSDTSDIEDDKSEDGENSEESDGEVSADELADIKMGNLSVRGNGENRHTIRDVVANEDESEDESYVSESSDESSSEVGFDKRPLCCPHTALPIRAHHYVPVAHPPDLQRGPTARSRAHDDENDEEEDGAVTVAELKDVLVDSGIADKEGNLIQTQDPGWSDKVAFLKSLMAQQPAEASICQTLSVPVGVAGSPPSPLVPARSTRRVSQLSHNARAPQFDTSASASSSRARTPTFLPSAHLLNLVPCFAVCSLLLNNHMSSHRRAPEGEPLASNFLYPRSPRREISAPVPNPRHSPIYQQDDSQTRKILNRPPTPGANSSLTAGLPIPTPVPASPSTHRRPVRRHPAQPPPTLPAFSARFGIATVPVPNESPAALQASPGSRSLTVRKATLRHRPSLPSLAGNEAEAQHALNQQRRRDMARPANPALSFLNLHRLAGVEIFFLGKPLLKNNRVFIREDTVFQELPELGRTYRKIILLSDLLIIGESIQGISIDKLSEAFERQCALPLDDLNVASITDYGKHPPHLSRFVLLCVTPTHHVSAFSSLSLQDRATVEIETPTACIRATFTDFWERDYWISAVRDAIRALDERSTRRSRKRDSQASTTSQGSVTDWTMFKFWGARAAEAAGDVDDGAGAVRGNAAALSATNALASARPRSAYAPSASMTIRPSTLHRSRLRVKLPALEMLPGRTTRDGVRYIRREAASAAGALENDRPPERLPPADNSTSMVTQQPKARRGIRRSRRAAVRRDRGAEGSLLDQAGRCESESAVSL